MPKAMGRMRSGNSLPNAAGEPGSVVPPSSASRALSFVSARPALISLLSVSTISAGVSRGATMPNTDEFLWPGTLVTTRLTLREEDAVTVPSVAVQVSQAGSFVFVVKDDKESVLKVALNEDNNDRLHEEADALRSIHSEFIVAIEQELTMNGRTVLVLQKAGDQFADVSFVVHNQNIGCHD